MAYWQVSSAWAGQNRDSAAYYQLRTAKCDLQQFDFDRGVPILYDLLATLPPLAAVIRAEAQVNLAHALVIQGNAPGAMPYLDQALALLEVEARPDTLVLAKACELKAIVYLYQDEGDSARKWIYRAHDLRTIAFDSLDRELGYSANTLHIVLSGLGDLEGANQAIQQAWDILTRLLPVDHPHIATLANNLATNLLDLGDPQAAQRYMRQAIASNQAGGRHRPLIENYSNVAYIYINLGEWETAESYIQRARYLADSLLPVPHEVRAQVYDGLGATHYHTGRLGEAEAYFRRAQAERIRLFPPGHSLLAQSVFNLGLVARDQDDFVAARRYFEQAQRERAAALGVTSLKWADATGELARLDWAEGNTTAALRRWRESLQVYRATASARHRYTIETEALLIEAFNQSGQYDSARTHLRLTWAGLIDDGQITVFMPEVLKFALTHLRFLEGQGAAALPTDWALAETRVRQVMDWLPDFLALYAGEAGQRAARADVQAFFRQAALLAYHALRVRPEARLVWEGILLDALQGARGARIRAALRQQQVQAFAGVPDSIVRRGRELEEQLRYTYGREREQALSEAAAQRRAVLFEAWQAHQAQLRQAYPAYYQARYASEALDPRAWQAQLGQTAVLAYLDLDSSLLIMKGASTGLETHLLPLPQGWQDSLATYQRLLRARQDPDRLAGLAYYLYRQLWEPLAPLPYRVRILPDGPLYGLNFETLLRSLPPMGTSPARWAYLLRDHCLYYDHSLAPEATQSLDPRRMLAIAPGFRAETKAAYAQSLPSSLAPDSTFMSWVSTPWSLDLVRELGRWPGAQALTGLEATERAYRAAAGQARLLHFATHARLDDADPMRSFLALVPEPVQAEDGYLYTYELYQQPLRAQLAVLTACETGLGQYQAGEGVLSLAHAFRFAGCPSVVYSLWSIDDEQSQVLVRAFYEHLRGGQSAAEALRAAKLAYLSQPGPADPYFWAGLVLTGADQPVRRAWPWWWIGLAALGVLGGSWVIYRRRQS